MKIELNSLLYASSDGLDAVEKELNGASKNHGKRVAFLSESLARATGKYQDPLALSEFTCLAILHDNAFTEYVREELDNPHPQGTKEEKTHRKVLSHTEEGEKNIALLPWRTDVKGVILYHHDNYDGGNAHHQKGEAIPLGARIIHLADMVDMGFDLPNLSQEGYQRILSFLQAGKGIVFDPALVDLFPTALPYSGFLRLQKKGPMSCLKEDVPAEEVEYSSEEVHGIASFFARIIDYKSSFTKDHSLGVANKAEEMAKHYGFDEAKSLRFYFAGAMHDVGKLFVPNAILEKPGKLTEEEFSLMKYHAEATYEVLSKIPHFEDIREWASNHHEKLDGTGYPRGLNASQLTFEDRLMGVIDIYQALTEQRPYKKGLSHAQTMEILRSMVEQGKIDGTIVEEVGKTFAKEEASAPVQEKKGKKWRCKVCGYVYYGDEPPVRCPVCGAPLTWFEEID